MRFTMTGEIKNRHTIKQIFILNGWTYVSDVKASSLVIYGSRAGSRLIRAEMLGIETLRV